MTSREEHHFRISMEDFDLSLLSAHVPERGTPAFREAVSGFLQTQFEGLGGRARITVGNEDIEIYWTPEKTETDLADRAVETREGGRLGEAVELNPDDQGVWFRRAQALEAEGNTAGADEAYKKVIHLDEYSEVAEQARQARTKIAHGSFRGRAGGGIRLDAVMYCLLSLRRFEKMSREEVQSIGFEIAMLGATGFDTNNPSPRYALRSLSGPFSGLHLVCLMYVAFRVIELSEDIGFDLSQEYAAARSLYERLGEKSGQ